MSRTMAHFLKTQLASLKVVQQGIESELRRLLLGVTIHGPEQLKTA